VNACVLGTALQLREQLSSESLSPKRPPHEHALQLGDTRLQLAQRAAADRLTVLFHDEKTQARIVFLACVQTVHVLSWRVPSQLGVELRDQRPARWIVGRKLAERRRHYFGQPVCGSSGVIFRAF
jgi:hypothetical protein